MGLCKPGFTLTACGEETGGGGKSRSRETSLDAVGG